MAEHTLLHHFHSNIADDSNTALVRPSDWNERHQFTGGDDGNILVRDFAQYSGFRFDTIANLIGGRVTTYATNAVDVPTGPISSPTGAVCVLNWTKKLSSSLTLIIAQVLASDQTIGVSLSLSVTTSITLDAVSIGTIPAFGWRTLHQYITMPVLTAGAHQIYWQLATSNAPFNSYAASFYVFEISLPL